MMITRERARRLRAIIEQAMSGVDNNTALNAVELFPVWSPSRAYSAGTRVRYLDALYECVQAHTSQSDWTPSAAVSLWSAVTIDDGTGYDVWTQPTGAQDAYSIGDIVLYNGVAYKSIIDGNVWSPNEYPAGWERI